MEAPDDTPSTHAVPSCLTCRNLQHRCVASFSCFIQHLACRQEEGAGQADLQDSSRTWDTGLHLPAWISQNERVQIEAKVDQWVRDLVQVHHHLPFCFHTLPARYLALVETPAGCTLAMLSYWPAIHQLED